MTTSNLFTPLSLPNGTVLQNRLCKAAMEENLCEYGQLPGQALRTLYSQWAKGGAGLILTGNVMVAPDALTGAGGVVLENSESLSRFADWAEAGKHGGAQMWMQISHPGRQMYANLGETAVAPSAVPLEMGGFSKLFADVRALSESEILGVVERFKNSALLAQKAGFDGVEIHAAHGYLVSQFLSPLVNKRDDQWGGSLENRARLLFTIVSEVRGAVGDNFGVGVKLNSADFQKGGFSQDDAKWVVSQLNAMQLDLLELSGGSYESPAMQGKPADNAESSTAKREAFFVDFAREVAAIADMPVMVTGGIRRKSVAEAALASAGDLPAVDLLGVATAMAYQPDLPACWQDDNAVDIDLPFFDWRNKTLGALATMAVTKHQLGRLSKAKSPQPKVNPVLSIIRDRIKTNRQARRYRSWRSSRS